jgi:hypothetical protein
VLSGAGALESIIPIFHERLLTLAILCPLALKLYSERHARSRGPVGVDVLVATFILYQVVRSVVQLPAQGYVRITLYLLLDVWVIYYVASRALSSIAEHRRVVVAFVSAMAILAVVAIFETSKSWLVYESLSAPFGTMGTAYHTRGDLGLLRARASAGHPITLGYNLGIALMLMYALAGRFASHGRQWLLAGLLVCGMIVTFSRGPWVGTAAGLLYMIITGPGKSRRIGYAVGLGSLAIGMLAMTPLGRSLYGMLPFVGTVDSGSIVYRQRLWDVSMIVLQQNLWLGDLFYRSDPLMETMRQGEGIIDMVNTYLIVSLSYGLIGLALFAGCFAAAWRCTRRPGPASGIEEVARDPLRRAYRAALVTIALTIATVSNIALIPVAYWLVIGLCAGYARLQAQRH